MKKVVSVSLGTSKRDKRQEVEILGEPFVIERQGVDGDMARFKARFEELDGQVDALGIGGADLYVVVGNKRYVFNEIKNLVSGVKKTPIVDGSGLKHTLERETINHLQKNGIVDFKNQTTLLVSAVDRFGMAQALVEAGGPVIYGDLLFGIGVPIPLRSYRSVAILGSIVLPIITKLPFKWFYPTGEKQEKRTPKYPKVFDECQIIAGDWHYIRRYAPDKMTGKTILTQTVREADIEWLRSAGVSRLVTTTPQMGGGTFATNVMEGVLVSILGKKPDEITPEEYLELLQKLNWKPNVLDLQSL